MIRHAITDIFGTQEVFEPGRTDDDTRFGCLSFGVLVPFSTYTSEPVT